MLPGYTVSTRFLWSSSGHLTLCYWWVLPGRRTQRYDQPECRLFGSASVEVLTETTVTALEGQDRFSGSDPLPLAPVG